MSWPRQIDHEERTDRRLCAILEISRGEKIMRAGGYISPGRRRVWQHAIDPSSHTPPAWYPILTR